MFKITGTFLDEITHDIPPQNWGAQEWAQDFDAMQAVGIDTVILIRAGYQKRCVFDSEVLQKEMKILPAYQDLMQVFLKNAERCGMDFYFGTYDSGNYWHSGNPQREVDINLDLCAEVLEKYGHSPAFKGWYFSHEIDTFNQGVMQVYRQLSEHLRKLKDIPILISPYIKGVKQFGGEAIQLDQHIAEWQKVFSNIEGLVDIVAFQDGNVPLEALPDYLAANRQLAAEKGIASWSNVESFDRDMPIKFPPTDIRKLLYKMEQAEKANMEKLITFEFSHFMSPNSIYPAAHQLYKRYQEQITINEGR
jgi:Domain of unknown function (DUF5109)/Domain of unknown function (DUF4434)